MIKDYLKEHVLNNGQEKQPLRGPEQAGGSTASPKEFLYMARSDFQVVFIFDYSSDRGSVWRENEGSWA